MACSSPSNYTYSKEIDNQGTYRNAAICYLPMEPVSWHGRIHRSNSSASLKSITSPSAEATRC